MKKQLDFLIENGKIVVNPNPESVSDQLRGQYIPDRSLQITFSKTKPVNADELKALLSLWKKAVSGKKPVEAIQHAPGAIAWKLEKGSDTTAQQSEWNRLRALALSLRREIEAKSDPKDAQAQQTTAQTTQQTAQKQQPTQQKQPVQTKKPTQQNSAQQAAKPAQQSTTKQTGAQPSAQQQKPAQQTAKPAQQTAQKQQPAQQNSTQQKPQQQKPAQQSTTKQTGAQPSAQQQKPAQQTSQQQPAQQHSKHNIPGNPDYNPNYDYFWRDFRSAHKEYFDPALSEDEQKEFVSQYWAQVEKIHSIFKA